MIVNDPRDGRSLPRIEIHVLEELAYLYLLVKPGWYQPAHPAERFSSSRPRGSIVFCLIMFGPRWSLIKADWTELNICLDSKWRNLKKGFGHVLMHRRSHIILCLINELRKTKFMERTLHHFNTCYMCKQQNMTAGIYPAEDLVAYLC